MGASTGSAALGAPGGPLFVPGFVSGCLSVQELQQSWHTLIAAHGSDSRAIEAEDDDIDDDVDVTVDFKEICLIQACSRTSSLIHKCVGMHPNGHSPAVAHFLLECTAVVGYGR